MIRTRSVIVSTIISYCVNNNAPAALYTVYIMREVDRTAYSCCVIAPFKVALQTWAARGQGV